MKGGEHPQIASTILNTEALMQSLQKKFFIIDRHAKPVHFALYAE